MTRLRLRLFCRVVVAGVCLSACDGDLAPAARQRRIARELEHTTAAALRAVPGVVAVHVAITPPPEPMALTIVRPQRATVAVTQTGAAPLSQEAIATLSANVLGLAPADVTVYVSRSVPANSKAGLWALLLGGALLVAAGAAYRYRNASQ